MLSPLRTEYMARAGLIFAAIAMMVGSGVSVADPATSQADTAKYRLRYKFAPGEALRWKVVERTQVKTTISGTSQTAESYSESVKLWRVLGADPGGNVKFENSVESVNMRQKVTGRAEIRYNSETDTEPPPAFQQTANSVGVPLAIVTIDNRGIIVERDNKQGGLGGVDTQITLPLPEEAVAIGDSWSQTYELDGRKKSGLVRKIRARQRFTLQEVKEGVATIQVETNLLTPINDPELEAQLIQREKRGHVRFDIEAGRVLAQQLDLEKRVIGFSGESSSLHYTTRFAEELLPAEDRTAQKARPVAGPKPPPTVDESDRPRRKTRLRR